MPNPQRPVKPSLATYGKRQDGTAKGKGYLGTLAVPGGKVATEYSISSDRVKNKQGQSVDFPSIVPTLSKQERKAMTQQIIPSKARIPEPIVKKAVAHANTRIAQNKSPFKQPSEPGRIPPRVTKKPR
jgi:hypothetical protein